MTGNGPAATPERALVLCADEDLLDDVLRLAAAAGVVPLVLPAPGSAQAAWSRAPLVVVGADLAGPTAQQVAAGALPRRRDVVLSCREPADATVWQLGAQLGAEQVVCLPDAEAWLAQRLAQAAEPPAERGLLVAVTGGRGGAGATVFATALGLAGLRAGLSTLLVDADPLGGGIDLVVGAEQQPGLRWEDLTGLRGRLPAGALRGNLPALGELSVLSFGRGEPAAGEGAPPPEAMSALLDAGCRDAQLVVVDVPRNVDAAARTVLGLARAALLLVPAEVRACAAASRPAARLTRCCPDVRLVVRGPGPARLDAGSVAAGLGLPLAATFRTEPAVPLALERGEPPGRGRGALARAADQVLAGLTGAAA